MTTTVTIAEDAVTIEITSGVSLAQVAAAILAGAPGGATVSDQVLKAWVTGEAFELLATTYDTTDVMVMATATVKWPDGSSGVFTTTAINATWKAIDAFTVTHVDSGKTVTQAAVTRNADGLITVKPALTVA